MNLWDRFLLIVWRCTIGPVLFCILTLCGIASFFLGGRSFFRNCWKMASYSFMVDWDSNIECSHAINLTWEIDFSLSRLLWTLLFGFWLRILFIFLMCFTHLLLCSDWLAVAMLDLADCARNPRDVGVFRTRNRVMDWRWFPRRQQSQEYSDDADDGGIDADDAGNMWNDRMESDV